MESESLSSDDVARIQQAAGGEEAPLPQIEVFAPATNGANRTASNPATAENGYEQTHCSENDIQVLQDLASIYQRGLEEKQISYMARYKAIRQTAVFSMIFMAIFIVSGCAFFMTQGENISLSEAALITSYTLTSAGYGSVLIPKTNSFLAFFICFIFIGISALAILVAQTFQYLMLESSRSQHKRDKIEGAQLGVELLSKIQCDEEHTVDPVNRRVRDELKRSLAKLNPDRNRNAKFFLSRWKNTYIFLHTETGRAVATILIFATLLLSGTFGMMAFEGWTFMQAFYFSVFSQTTVGYGNFVPTSAGSTWFVVFWLPSNVLFLALFLCSVAHYWVMFCTWHLHLVEEKLRVKSDEEGAHTSSRSSHIPNALDEDYIKADVVEDDDDEMAMAAKTVADEDDGTDVVASATGETGPSNASIVTPVSSTTPQQNYGDRLQSTPAVGQQRRQSGMARRERIRELSGLSSMLGAEEQAGAEMTNSTRIELASSAHGILKTVHQKLERGDVHDTHERLNSLLFGSQADEDSFLSLRLDGSTPVVEKPVPLALRLLVEERMAYIITHEIAGSNFDAELKDDYTLEVTIKKLKYVADKWQIPGLARTAYREVVFESLFYIGERDLLKNGAMSFFSLTPAQFNSILSLFVVAMGDADTMEGWLTSTEAMAAAEFPAADDDISSPSGMPVIEEETGTYGPRCVVKEEIDDFFPVNQGNAVLITQR